jgi:hypothetical protein
MSLTMSDRKAHAKLLELTLLRTEGALSERPLSSVPDDNAEDIAC